MTTTLQKAITYHQNGKLSMAESIYKKILKKDRANADAWHLLGVLFYQMGELDIAINNIKKAIMLNPHASAYYSNLGLAYQQKSELALALESYDKALALQPNYPEALNNKGNVLREKGTKEANGEALACYRKALQLRPDYCDAMNNIGNLFESVDQAGEAITWYQKAVDCNPLYADAYNNLGLAYRKAGKLKEAAAALAKAVSLPSLTNPLTLSTLLDTKRELCEWAECEVLETALVKKAVDPATPTLCDPFTVISKLHQSKELQYRLTREYVHKKTHQASQRFSHTITEKEKIRVGYVSADLFDHPTMHLAGGLFALHNRESFEVVLFGLNADTDSSYFKQASSGADRYIDISDMDDQAAAACIYDEQIDILIDLQGLTKNCRPGIFSYRPAPVQMQYLAFAGTTAHPEIDYILTDRVVTPEEDAEFFSEKFIYLPDSYQVNDAAQEIGNIVPSRNACGLPATGTVLCCFNNAYKIEPVIFTVWMAILTDVPESVLWLYATNESTKENLRLEAEKRGIDPKRLVFADKLLKADHLARLKQADIFLDTYYYNAHTTASDALFAGVPLITCRGDRFASRVASSLLRAVGLKECIAVNLNVYKEMVVSLANDPVALSQLKTKLQQNKTAYPLFDTKIFVKNMEKGLLLAWRNYLDKQDPKMIHVESEAAS